MRNPWFLFSMLILLSFTSCVYIVFNGISGVVQNKQVKLSQDSILYLQLDGVIMDGEDFLSDLREYASEPSIKAVLIRMNSPGGVVGPSQEIYHELLRIRTELKKPVVVSANALMASGGYYIAVAADKILVNEGTLMGSIGVIMEFANLEKLYDWAKVKRYSITTGKFKDTGSDARAMRDDEREFLQNLINEVHSQFKTAVVMSRKLDVDLVEQNADGRIFTGATGVKLGFADQIGGLHEAIRVASKLAGSKEDLELFDPNESQRELRSLLGSMSEKIPALSSGMQMQNQVEKVFPLDLFGKPLYLMPQYLNH